jgi:hypothetical protein
MARTPAYASRNSGKPPPWRARDVNLVLPIEVGRRIRREVSRLSASGEFTIRRFGTIVVWSGGEPIGSFTLVRNHPDAASATIRRIEWDERRGQTEADVWRAIDLLGGEGARVHLHGAGDGDAAAEGAG